MPDVLFGREEPRLWTRPLRPLTPQTSRGFAVIEFAEDVLEVELYPWQKWFLIHALEILPSGRWRFRKVILLVARQNGKSLLLQVLSLWRMYLGGKRLVLGTAQDLGVAEEQWGLTVELAESVEDLAEEITGIVKTNGQKALKIANGSRYKVTTATRKGGRGLTVSMVLLDELREHQSWDAWSAVTNTTNAVADAQILGVSNAGDLLSVVLATLRKQGLDAIESGADRTEENSLGLFEWSAVDSCAVDDLDGLAQANPSLGHRVTLDALLSSAQTARTGVDAEWSHRTEVLCQWRPTAKAGPFPTGAWDSRLDKTSRIGDGEQVAVAVEVAADRSAAHVVAAGRRADGEWHVEVIATRAGVDWLVGWFGAKPNPDGPTRRELYPIRVYQKGSQAATEAEALGMTEVSGLDAAVACGVLFTAITANAPVLTEQELARGLAPGAPGTRVWHLEQPVLDVPASVAGTKVLGAGSWVIDRKGVVDASPLMGAALALHQAKTAPPPPGPSVYESRGLVIV